jgi:ribosomal protein L13
MKGGDIKGSEVWVVFTAMDAFLGKNRSQVASILAGHKFQRFAVHKIGTEPLVTVTSTASNNLCLSVK